MTRTRNKFGAVRTVVDGITFASKREAERYAVLASMERAGLIRNLECQVRFPLMVGNVLVGRYVADFVYDDAEDRQIVEDCKGYRTPVYRLKAKLMRAVHGIEIRET